jgi:hypothetical protein
MPYSQNAQYYHHRQHDPRSFSEFATISMISARMRKLYTGNKYNKAGNLVIIGKNIYTGEWQVQSILEKKR